LPIADNARLFGTVNFVVGLFRIALHCTGRPSKRTPVPSADVSIHGRFVRIGPRHGDLIRHAGVDS